MLSDQDQKFYTALIGAILLLLVAFRLVLMFVGVDVEIPYLDAILKGIWGVLGAIMTGVANILGTYTH
jgi:hypothetical protein